VDDTPFRIESLLSARLFLVPQVVGDRLYFISNLSGRNSLYAMKLGGSVPQPLLPPHIALQNPHLMAGRSFVVFPALEQILVMIDNDGDEQYRPMLVPVSGGYPQPLFAEELANHRVDMLAPDLEQNVVYFIADANDRPLTRSYLANITTGELTLLNESRYAGIPAGHNAGHDTFILLESYGAGDNVVFTRRLGDTEEPALLYGKPLALREPGEEVAPTGINELYFTPDEQGLIFRSILFDDRFGVGFMPHKAPANAEALEVQGLVHEGEGELEGLEKLDHPSGEERYLLRYNIDGASWAYEGTYDEATRRMVLGAVVCGQGALANGTAESIRYDEASGTYAISFSTANSPSQLVLVAGDAPKQVTFLTRNRVLGIPEHLLAGGEDAGFTSHDGLHITARLYLPAPALGYEGKLPVVVYIHGGPQGQERPDFTWFSMPLIQFLTLNGMAVFVPNVRGSTGYGFAYMKHVVRDWGGQDRLDHVHAMTEVLPQDPRIDTGRAGVVGRSYGGYMTLTLAGRHPELWSAAVDMFGPYDLITFAERVPETWKPFMAALVGDPETEREFLVERSPRTHIVNISAPLLVIQGNNDPRVREIESRELVEHLRELGKTVDYLMLPDEGHDVLKFDNRVRVYNAITDFFKQYLHP